MAKTIIQAILTLALAGASAAHAQLPYQGSGYIQDVRIMGVGPGGVGNTFGIIISSTVPFLDISNTFTTTQTINAKDINGFSLRLSSGIMLGGCVQYGDGSRQCTATVTDPGVSIELSQLNASTQTLAIVKGSTGTCPSGYLVQDIWASSITCAAVLSTIYTAQPITGDGSVGNPVALDSTWQNGLAVSTTSKVSKSGDTMTGQLTIAGATLTVQGQDASNNSIGTTYGIKSGGNLSVVGASSLDNGLILTDGAGALTIGGRLNATGGAIFGTTPSTASFGSDGTLQLQAGASTQAARSTGGQVYAVVASSKIQDTGMTTYYDFFNYGIPPNILSANGQELYMVCAGTSAGNANTRSIIMTFNGVVISSISTPTGVAGTVFNDWILQATIVRLGPSYELLYQNNGTIYTSATVAGVTNYGSLGGQTLAAPLTWNTATSASWKCSVKQTSAGDAVLSYRKYEWKKEGATQ